MKLYTLLVRHVAPKDWHDSIEKYLIADSEEQLYDYCSQLSSWNYKEDDEEPFHIYDDHWNIIGEENWHDRMIRLRGEINEPDPDYSDAYYSVTVYGWDEGKSITEVEREVLMRLVAVEDIRFRFKGDS